MSRAGENMDSADYFCSDHEQLVGLRQGLTKCTSYGLLQSQSIFSAQKTDLHFFGEFRSIWKIGDVGLKEDEAAQAPPDLLPQVVVQPGRRGATLPATGSWGEKTRALVIFSRNAALSWPREIKNRLPGPVSGTCALGTVCRAYTLNSLFLFVVREIERSKLDLLSVPQA